MCFRAVFLFVAATTATSRPICARVVASTMTMFQFQLLVLGLIFFLNVQDAVSLSHSPGASPTSSTGTQAQMNRRHFGQQIGFSFLVAGSVSVGMPHSGRASSGDSANMELPSYIEFLIEKNKIPQDGLYNGPDPQVQLRRLLEAAKSLQTVPSLAEQRKWSQVQGVLAGPLGTLVQTMAQVSKQSSSAGVQASAKKLKADLFAINTAATKKDEKTCIRATQLASEDLDAFVKAAFE